MSPHPLVVDREDAAPKGLYDGIRRAGESGNMEVDLEDQEVEAARAIEVGGQGGIGTRVP